MLFDDFDLSISSGPLSRLFGGNLDIRPVDPAERGIVRYDMAALKAENVDGLNLHNFSLHWNAPVPAFFHAGIELAGFHNATIDGFSGTGPSEGAPTIWLRKGTGVAVAGARTLRGPLVVYDDVTGTVAPSAGSK